MEWISVKDRLPEIGHKVLIYCNDNKGIFIGYRIKNAKWCALGHFGERICAGSDIDYWCSLPEPPVEKTKEELEIEMWSLMS